MSRAVAIENPQLLPGSEGLRMGQSTAGCFRPLRAAISGCSPHFAHLAYKRDLLRISKLQGWEWYNQVPTNLSVIAEAPLTSRPYFSFSYKNGAT